MTRTSYLAVFGGLIVLTVLLTLTRIVPTPETDGKSELREVRQKLGRSGLDHSPQIKRALVAFIGVQVDLPVLMSNAMLHAAHRKCAGCKTGFTTSTEAKYNYALRRQALRESWFPNSQDGLDECVLLLVLHQHWMSP